MVTLNIFFFKSQNTFLTRFKGLTNYSTVRDTKRSFGVKRNDFKLKQRRSKSRDSLVSVYSRNSLEVAQLKRLPALQFFKVLKGRGFSVAFAWAL